MFQLSQPYEAGTKRTGEGVFWHSVNCKKADNRKLFQAGVIAGGEGEAGARADKLTVSWQAGPIKIKGVQVLFRYFGAV